MRSAPQYPIGRSTLTFALAVGLIFAGILLVAGMGSASPHAPVSRAVPSASPIATGYRLQIPRLRIDLPLAEGDVARDIDLQQTPEGFAFHLPGTAIPGA